MVYIGKAGQKNRGGNKWKPYIGPFNPVPVIHREEYLYALCVIECDSNGI